jgi:hypothetical protein
MSMIVGAQPFWLLHGGGESRKLDAGQESTKRKMLWNATRATPVSTEPSSMVCELLVRPILGCAGKTLRESRGLQS